MNNVACNILNQYFFSTYISDKYTCHVSLHSFLLDGFINGIPSQIITVDVKRKAIGSPDWLSTLLMLKLPEKKRKER